jgi:hypothetical protein
VFSPSNELVVPTSRAKLVAMAVGSATFVVTGAWLLSRAAERGPVFAAVGMSAVAFFGLCGIYALFRLARPSPAVVINHRGIVDNASALGVGLVPWENISELREYRFQNQVFLGIIPRDLDQILLKLPGWKRAAIRANLRLGAAPMNIPQATLPMSVSELLREIEVRFRRLPNKLQPTSGEKF